MKLHAILTTMLLSVAFVLALTAVPAAAEDGFDVRDHLPLGTLFYLDDDLDLELIWNGQNLDLTSSDTEFGVGEWLNRSGQLVFVAAPLDEESDIELIRGRLDILPEGHPELMVDITYKSSTVLAQRMSQVYIGDPTVIQHQICDCSDKINLLCKTNHCNDQDPCPQPAQPNTICKWQKPTVRVL